MAEILERHTEGYIKGVVGRRRGEHFQPGKLCDNFICLSFIFLGFK